jgi:hypothetical protein
MDARFPRLGKTDGDRLLGRPRPVHALSNVLDLFADECPGLRLGRFALPFGFVGSF